MTGVVARILARTYDTFVRDRFQVVVPRGEQDLLVLTQRVDGEVLDERWEPVPTGIARGTRTEDSRAAIILDVQENVGRAIYEALRDRYEPELADARRLVRADLELEQRRVDRLLDVVSRVALDGVAE